MPDRQTYYRLVYSRRFEHQNQRPRKREGKFSGDIKIIHDEYRHVDNKIDSRQEP